MLKDQVAIVTGGGRGIGAACARALAEAGARVVVASRTRGELEQVVARIEAVSGKGMVHDVITDVAAEGDVVRLFAEARERFGKPVAVLVNCAGAVSVDEVAKVQASDWDRVMAVNVRGSFLCARELFRQPGGGGAIVNMSSLSGIRGTEKFKGLCAYVASKHAVVGLTESLAVEGRERGIRVNCVAPGAVDTVMLRTAAPHLKTRTRPEDIAKTVLFLCDESQSGALNGAVIEVHSNL
jgi:3-oxoacyl-[acyl-carrier protein] reductase